MGCRVLMNVDLLSVQSIPTYTVHRLYDLGMGINEKLPFVCFPLASLAA